ncbi:MAG TPA: hypothetical protein VFH47_06715, partial [Candidatus Thermoplasmatota archaeon]|nr:hypothetical protein [Candidatus Thermoplasmatota archaeon]
ARTAAGAAGGTGSTDPAAAPARGEPDARAQLAYRQLRTVGFTLLIAAVLLLFMYASMIRHYPDAPAGPAQASAGGDLTVLVDPPTEALVRLTHDGATIASQTTGPDGRARFDDVQHAGVRVEVLVENATWARNVWVPRDTQRTVTVGETEAADAPEWIGWRQPTLRDLAAPMATVVLMMLGATAMVLRRFYFLGMLGGGLTVGLALQFALLFLWGGGGPLGGAIILPLALGVMGIWSIVLLRRARPLIARRPGAAA